MPKGSPNAQTKATEKYQKKKGYKAKAFKLKEEDIEAFEKACEKAGVSQASQITKLMKQFVEEMESIS